VRARGKVALSIKQPALWYMAARLAPCFCHLLGAFQDCGILEAVAWLQMPRGAFAGGFCGILGAFEELF